MDAPLDDQLRPSGRSQQIVCPIHFHCATSVQERVRSKDGHSHITDLKGDAQDLLLRGLEANRSGTVYLDTVPGSRLHLGELLGRCHHDIVEVVDATCSKAAA